MHEWDDFIFETTCLIKDKCTFSYVNSHFQHDNAQPTKLWKISSNPLPMLVKSSIFTGKPTCGTFPYGG